MKVRDILIGLIGILIVIVVFLTVGQIFQGLENSHHLKNGIEEIGWRPVIGEFQSEVLSGVKYAKVSLSENTNGSYVVAVVNFLTDSIDEIYRNKKSREVFLLKKRVGPAQDAYFIARKYKLPKRLQDEDYY